MKPNSEYKRTDRLLTVEGLNLDFGGKPILRNIHLSIDDIVRPNMAQGQIIALLGPSGIGKTQLFKCISGLMAPSSGKVLIRTEAFPTGGPVNPGEVGIVFQHYPLLNHRTVIENLYIAAGSTKKKRDDVHMLLKTFDLDSKANSYPFQLSGGQRQRISVIQQLVCSEHFVLLDEPFSGLDVLSKQKMMDLLLRISTVHEHNTLILTTHDIEAAVSIADTIWMLGYEKDSKGAQIPGATIVMKMDLIDRGLAWNPDVRSHPAFRQTCDGLYSAFKSFC